MSKGLKGRFMTEEELRERLTKLQEIEAQQEKKLKEISESIEKIRKRQAKESRKLTDTRSEIMKMKGYLYDKTLLKYGIKTPEQFESFVTEHFKNKAARLSENKAVSPDARKEGDL